jgi:hypothetical protein
MITNEDYLYKYYIFLYAVAIRVYMTVYLIFSSVIETVQVHLKAAYALVESLLQIRRLAVTVFLFDFTPATLNKLVVLICGSWYYRHADGRLELLPVQSHFLIVHYNIRLTDSTVWRGQNSLPAITDGVDVHRG